MHKLGWLLLVALLAGCGSSQAANAALPPGAISPAVTLGADSLRVMPDSAATFDEIASLLKSAKTSIDVEMYEFGRSDLRDDLIAAHRRGVRVSVIVDPTVDVSATTAAQLRAAGISVHDYPVRSEMIDHVKLLLADNRTAIVGGINWGSGSWQNHDFDAELTGPAVENLLRIFQSDLAIAGEPSSVAAGVPDTNITVLSTLPTSEIGTHAVALIDSARQSIELDLFVLTSSAVVNALERAEARGVVIHLLLDPSQRPSDSAANELKSHGVAVRLYRSAGELLHAKVIVVDGKSVLFGSANWSSGGFQRNHEVDLEIDNAPVVAGLFLPQMQSDWNGSAD